MQLDAKKRKQNAPITRAQIEITPPLWTGALLEMGLIRSRLADGPNPAALSYLALGVDSIPKGQDLSRAF